MIIMPAYSTISLENILSAFMALFFYLYLVTTSFSALIHYCGSEKAPKVTLTPIHWIERKSSNPLRFDGRLIGASFTAR